MAKGRRLTTSRSDRYLGQSHTAAAPSGGSELFEEDVWSTYGADNGDKFDEAAAQFHYTDPSVDQTVTVWSTEGSARTTSSRMSRQISIQNGVVLGPRRRHHLATSAPMNVPDWGKILRVDSSESCYDDSDDEPDSGVDPPHEYLARSRMTTATSVFEGVGRTLKGRDMSRLRDAVWSQTGFDG